MRRCLILVCGLITTASPSLMAAPSEREIAQALTKSFAAAAKVITPSVVSIAVSGSVPKESNEAAPRTTIPPFGPFEGEGMEHFAPGGFGTGFVVDERGHIVTNDHVLGDGERVMVRVGGKHVYSATIIKRIKEQDLALIKISARDLVAATLGDSSTLQIGQWVIAAGNPFGLENSITAGIVSATGRSFLGNKALGDFIQTDAAINPGNSGGPLIDLDGRVVGVNSAIFSRSGGYMGIGFAIPVNRVKQLISEALGGTTAPTNSAHPSEDGDCMVVGRALGCLGLTFSKSPGTLVIEMVRDASLASLVGFRAGDVVSAVNGHAVKTAAAFEAAIVAGKRMPVRIAIERGGRREELLVSGL